MPRKHTFRERQVAAVALISEIYDIVNMWEDPHNHQEEIDEDCRPVRKQLYQHLYRMVNCPTTVVIPRQLRPDDPICRYDVTARRYRQRFAYCRVGPDEGSVDAQMCAIGSAAKNMPSVVWHSTPAEDPEDVT